MILTVARRAVFLVAILSSSLVMAQIPAGYYSSAQGKTGEDLKKALHDIIDDHTEISYAKAYDALEVLDRDPNDADLVIGIYSKFKMDADKQYDGGAGWNREHVWPKSFGDFGTTKGAGTDLHHLRTADVSTNSNRNNRSFAAGGAIFQDTHGNYSGTTEAKKGQGTWTWEPPDSVKGDVARMVLYMVVRYEGGGGEPDLELTEAIQRNSDKTPFLGVRSQILQWHRGDPVAPEERVRNDLVYTDYQGNRNPFIDHPEYVDAIWGTEEAPTALATSEIAAESELEVASTVEVGTFNLYWLGTEMRYRKGLRTEQDVQRLADLVINELDLEVIAFQEVNSEMNGTFELNDRQREMSDQQFKWLKQSMEGAGYKLLVGDSGDKQRIVIAYDADEVTLLSDARELASPSSSGRLRKPLAANFKAGEFDFWVVAVHLKSKRGGWRSDRKRIQQSEDLLDDIATLADDSGEQDIILLGDFNAESSHDSIDLLYHEGGFLAQTRQGRRTADSNDVSYLIGDFASLIDHIMLRPEHTSELIRRSTVVYKPDDVDDYIENYSDHVPVWTSFSTELDAD